MVFVSALGKHHKSGESWGKSGRNKRKSSSAASEIGIADQTWIKSVVNRSRDNKGLKGVGGGCVDSSHSLPDRG